MTRSLTAVPDLGPTWQQVGLLFSAADTGLPSIYWPWLVDCSAIPGATGSRWRCYYSTDHDPGLGGIAYSEAADVTGPWSHRGIIYVDTAGGSQTETPSVAWIPELGRWHLWYQQAGMPSGYQSTLWATSPDGLAWTRQGYAIRTPTDGSYPGDGHTGYFIPQRLPGDRWVGYHLMGGRDHPHFGQSWSDDGIAWRTDPRPLGYGLHLTQALGGRRVEWNSGYLVQHGGGLWWVGTLSGWQSGTDAKDAAIVQAPIAPDLRTLLAPPVQVLPEVAGNVRAINVTTDADGETWMVWQRNDEFGLARCAA